MAEANVSSPPPKVDAAGLYERLPGIWIIPDGRVPLVPNIGVILGDHSALVVDCGMGPANGETVLKVARKLAGDRRLLLTLTHYHPEHGFGAQAFADHATILYNAAQRDELAAKGEAYLGMFRGFGPDVVAALEGTRFVSPDIAYHGTRCDIDLGNRLVQLLNWGMAHTAGDQVVFLPQERVLFTGDLAEEGIFPIFPWFPPHDVSIDGARWIEILAACEALRPAVVVPGHGAVGGAAILVAVRTYLADLAAAVAQRRDAGQTLEAVLADQRPAMLTRHPNWQAPEWIDHAIRYFFETTQS